MRSSVVLVLIVFAVILVVLAMILVVLAASPALAVADRAPFVRALELVVPTDALTMTIFRVVVSNYALGHQQEEGGGDGED